MTSDRLSVTTTTDNQIAAFEAAAAEVARDVDLDALDGNPTIARFSRR